ncbi:MAG: hypothetical protein L0H63_10080 [Nitrococcus sp.]|nr:hypothetical protein [Nitrococcus sp.]
MTGNTSACRPFRPKRGKFYRPDAKLNLPIYLDDDVRDYLANRAKSKNVEVNEIVNDLLRKDIELMEGVNEEPSLSADDIGFWFLRLFHTRVSRKRRTTSHRFFRIKEHPADEICCKW